MWLKRILTQTKRKHRIRIKKIMRIIEVDPYISDKFRNRILNKSPFIRKMYLEMAYSLKYKKKRELIMMKKFKVKQSTMIQNDNDDNENENQIEDNNNTFLDNVLSNNNFNNNQNLYL